MYRNSKMTKIIQIELAESNILKNLNAVNRTKFLITLGFVSLKKSCILWVKSYGNLDQYVMQN